MEVSVTARQGNNNCYVDEKHIYNWLTGFGIDCLFSSALYLKRNYTLMPNALIYHWFLYRSPNRGKKGLYVADKVLQFPVTMVGKKSEAKVKICNGSADTQYLVSWYFIIATIVIYCC